MNCQEMVSTEKRKEEWMRMHLATGLNEIVEDASKTHSDHCRSKGSVA